VLLLQDGTGNRPVGRRLRGVAARVRGQPHRDIAFAVSPDAGWHFSDPIRGSRDD
jgi:hypothetical protein